MPKTYATDTKPEEKPVAPRIDAIRSETGERGWLSVEFSGFDANDNISSLFRRWEGRITAIRSDGEAIIIPVISLSSDTPFRTGDSIQRGLMLLETYRNCACVAGKTCQPHVHMQEIQAE